MTAENAKIDPDDFGQIGEFMDRWCVWSKHGRRPCYWHKSRHAAQHEAKRLARNFPTQKFIVLHAVAKFGGEPSPEPEAEAADAAA